MDKIKILFPAHAGVIPRVRPAAPRSPSFPRACGGDPGRRVSCQRHRLFSPRMRG